MGTRIKTFVSTGIAPDGKLYAGDLNAMEDQYADLFNLAQAIGIGSLALGESGLQLLRYGAGEARLSGALRTDGILRALGGLYAGAFTTTARNAISSPPYGLIILNTTTNRYEWNSGSPGTPSWIVLGSAYREGVFGSIGAADPTNANSLYFATDVNGGTLYISNGTIWRKVAAGLTEAPTIPDGSVTIPKLSFDPATQAELDAEITARAAAVSSEASARAAADALKLDSSKIKYGQTVISHTGDVADTINYPVAFPTATDIAFAQVNGSNSYIVMGSWNAASFTFMLSVYNGSPATGSYTVNWFAIGH